MKSVFIFLLALIAILIAGCDSVHHLEVTEFLKKSERLKTINLANWLTYLGIKNGKVILEEGNVITSTGDPEITTYWTELNLLPAELQNEILSGIYPWIVKASYRNENPNQSP